VILLSVANTRKSKTADRVIVVNIVLEARE